jgi:hypothetical protein
MTRLDVPTRFYINRTWNGGENSSFLKPCFSRFWRFFCLFVCLQYEKLSNLETKTCTLIWNTNPRSPQSFSSIGPRTTEIFQFLSDTRHIAECRQTLDARSITIVIDFNKVKVVLDAAGRR